MELARVPAANAKTGTEHFAVLTFLNSLDSLDEHPATANVNSFLTDGVDASMRAYSTGRSFGILTSAQTMRKSA